MRTIISLIIVWVTLLIFCSTPSAAPLGSGFTYQGQINAGALPINGVTHLRFSLWDDAGTGAPPTGGNQLGVSQLLSNVPVANGVFVVLLNAGGEFGATAFNGEARWLQIEVCTDPVCTNVTVLSPRQPLTGAPYSLGPWNTTATGDIVYTGPGKIGIGTATPAKKLTVAGDSELGTHHGDYVHLRLGGGNSSGFLYGSFPRYGDGIHLGYNYIASPAGSDITIQPDGGTSRISAGYGYVALATGLANEPPINRLVVEDNGNVRIGANTLLHVSAGEESLRTIRGVIAANGDIIAGSGFTVNRPESGKYDITFNTAFKSAPTVTATADVQGEEFATVATTNGVTAAGARIELFITGNYNRISHSFHFIATGPR